MNINTPKPGVLPALPFMKKRKTTHIDGLEDGVHPGHLPGFVQSLKPTIRNHFVAMCGELIGTFLFLFFALSGTQVANNVPSTVVDGTTQTAMSAGSNPAQLQYIALCFGFSLAVNAWVFFRISGGLFNPAVSLSFHIDNAVPVQVLNKRTTHLRILLNQEIGYLRHVPCRRPLLEPRWPLSLRPDPRWYHFCSLSILYVSRSPNSKNYARRQHHNHTRSLYRDVPYRAAGLCHLHARGRETPKVNKIILSKGLLITRSS